MSGLEVLSIVAAIPALIQLGLYCSKMTVCLYDFARNSKKIGLEITKYALELHVTGVIIKEALSDLKQHAEALESSNILENLVGKKVFTNIATASGYLKRDIARLIPFFRKGSEGGCIWIKTRVQWKRKKKEFLELFLRMENIKSNLHLCILMLSTGYSRARWRRGEGYDSKILRQINLVETMRSKLKVNGVDEEDIFTPDYLGQLKKNLRPDSGSGTEYGTDYGTDDGDSDSSNRPRGPTRPSGGGSPGGSGRSGGDGRSSGGGGRSGGDGRFGGDANLSSAKGLKWWKRHRPPVPGPEQRRSMERRERREKRQEQDKERRREEERKQEEAGMQQEVKRQQEEERRQEEEKTAQERRREEENKKEEERKVVEQERRQEEERQEEERQEEERQEEERQEEERQEEERQEEERQEEERQEEERKTRRRREEGAKKQKAEAERREKERREEDAKKQKAEAERREEDAKKQKAEAERRAADREFFEALQRGRNRASEPVLVRQLF